MKKIVIIGGGLAGLINSIRLSRAGYEVLLLEKKKYPFHRVCGEYVSNEVVPFLQSINCFPAELSPAKINYFQLTSVDGKSQEMPLDLGAFGISRYLFDHYLAEKARNSGVTLIENASVESIDFVSSENNFKVTVKGGQVFQGRLVIGAFGKRSTLDSQMQRSFTTRRSPYIGVKYHIKTDFPADKVALHNFKGGYCGISKVENDIYNLCYLAERDPLKKMGDISTMEEVVVCENPHLMDIWKNSDFMMEKPLVINEISFEKKLPVEQHVFMSGDAAGMITPLCGNGMAMAIHSAKILSDIIIENGLPETKDKRKLLENIYSKQWQNLFSTRLWVGRNTQKLFGGKALSALVVKLTKLSPAIATSIMKKTHGKPF